MTVHDRHAARSAQALMGVSKPAKLGLVAVGLTNFLQRLVVFSATFQDIETLLPRARRAMGVDAYVPMRPEGRWDRPGVLDRSAQLGSGQVATCSRVAASKKTS